MRRVLATSALAFVLGVPATVHASDHWDRLNASGRQLFVLRANPDVAQQVCQDYGLECLEPLGRSYVWAVAAPKGASSRELVARVNVDPRVVGFESRERVLSPEQRSRPKAQGAVAQSDLCSALPSGLSTTTTPALSTTTTPALSTTTTPTLATTTTPALSTTTTPALSTTTTPALSGLDRTPLDFYGGTAWAGFANQPAALRIGADEVRARGQTGRGVVVAVIDTGVDPDHPLLNGALVPGYDFTRDIASASEWADLAGTSYASATEILCSNPDFGHGTMVAGLVRLVAPEARIMPLKAFSADGSADMLDILRAIYYAVDHGAKVINMSFDSESREIQRAIEYATSRGVLCVGAAGNEGIETLVYPAALRRVFGVAATTIDDQRAVFSNYGERLVKLAAPGVDVITVWPGEHYAVVSGTSFSTALVSGATAVLVGAGGDLTFRTAQEAFEHSVFISEELGYGRIDLPEALNALAELGRRRGGRGVGEGAP